MNKEGVLNLMLLIFQSGGVNTNFLFERRDSFKRSLCHMINKILHIKNRPFK